MANHKTDKKYLGKLCQYGHEFEDSGQTLRYQSNSLCVICHNQREGKNKKVIDTRMPKDQLLNIHPLKSTKHYIGRVCPNNHKYFGESYSVRYKCNRVCVKCHKNNLHLEKAKHRIDNSMSRSIRESLMGKKNNHTWTALVGYSLEQLINHLQSKFNIWMTWDNYGNFWHIDHIIPKSAFKYSSYDEPEFFECWALANLQPLERTINLTKGDKRHKKYGNL